MGGEFGEGLRVLLTGGGGLVGRRLAPLLRERHEVTHFDVRDPGDGLPCVEGDLRDAELVREACRGMDVVVHVAGIHGPAWRELGDHALFEINVTGTYNILQGAAQAGVRRVVFTSSIHATGRAPMPPPYLPVDEELPREPLDVYGLSKQLGERMCRYVAQVHGLSVIRLRPGWIAPEDADMPRQFTKVFYGVDVRDVAQAHALAVEAPADVRDEVMLVTAASPLCGVPAERYFADPAGTLERFYPGIRAMLEAGTLALPGQQEWHSIERARRLLGYRPRHNFELPQ
ncbi:MAG: NAD(P)-dependent oxidoreductase [Armatimonadetes bacterium]|nr:NAD(P)-dependent oxidoreductase [Armatimonadota bacterium]